ncbi:MAG: PhnD/SsuA/transferrin family substrate-binding protein [Acidaminococcus sp.]|jgi:phosphonate transport system substrate-binding protein|nr:PhnD/SsuA/transferrin family substrate-binding protein [Acidaminococcus sp.]MCI2099860.1 PhnD/SsuA/transferrin family substrate-binding protein [Acidaminococcus sp.]MCI2114091.1 PhnD/SsuA/transferrin family substrate-binding protein [Acidaminococcus sp.]MCI2116031.1 PhnD/SsuA/transferrin family substrate-binding protein [Acidaminococcus sp.]
MKMKKWMIGALTICTAATLFSGCGGEKQSSGKKAVPELKIAISPYQDADTLKTKTEPLGKMLQDKMKVKGYPIDKVTINVGTSYSAVGEALSSGSADVGFISGATYVMYDSDVDVLLTALREGIDKDTTDLSVWNNGKPDVFTKNLVKYYRSAIVVGPSEKGKAILDKVKRGEKPTWEELNNLTWAVMSPASASGYLYPSLWLKQNYGKKISDLSHVVQSDSYTTSTARLATGQVDVMVAYSHIRAKMANDWSTKLGGTGDIWSQTGVIGVTDKIFNDTVSISKTSKVMQDEGFRKALGESLIEIGKTEDGLAVLKTIGHKGYDWADAHDYDGERTVRKEVK